MLSTWACVQRIYSSLIPHPSSFFSDSLATGHWYNSDGSLSDIYRERLLKRGRSIAEIEELDETARREFQIRQEWRESLAAHRKRYGGRGDQPQQALIDRAIARSTLCGIQGWTIWAAIARCCSINST